MTPMTTDDEIVTARLAVCGKSVFTSNYRLFEERYLNEIDEETFITEYDEDNVETSNRPLRAEQRREAGLALFDDELDRKALHEIAYRSLCHKNVKAEAERLYEETKCEYHD